MVKKTDEELKNLFGTDPVIRMPDIIWWDQPDPSLPPIEEECIRVTCDGELEEFNSSYSLEDRNGRKEWVRRERIRDCYYCGVSVDWNWHDDTLEDKEEQAKTIQYRAMYRFDDINRWAHKTCHDKKMLKDLVNWKPENGS